MKRRLLAPLLLSALCALPVHADTANCPPREALAPLLDAQGIFLGELHGSAEIPALVECLARSLLDELAGRRLTVALEIPPDALDDAHPFWRGQDGRASQAMRALLHAMKTLQSQGRLDLIGFAPTEYYPDQAGYEAAMARALDATPQSHFLLALAGNFHARGRGTEGVADRQPALVPAGALLKRRMRHVLVTYREASESWLCLGGKCAVHALEPSPSAAGKTPGLHPLGAHGYEQVLVLPRQTASPPVHAASAAPAALP